MNDLYLAERNSSAAKYLYLKGVRAYQDTESSRIIESQNRRIDRFRNELRNELVELVKSCVISASDAGSRKENARPTTPPQDLILPPEASQWLTKNGLSDFQIEKFVEDFIPSGHLVSATWRVDPEDEGDSEPRLVLRVSSNASDEEFRIAKRKFMGRLRETSRDLYSLVVVLGA